MMTKCEIIILGCGGSGGTPLACGHWGHADSSEPKNRRTRPSIVIRTARTCLVIDTGTDFREQTIRENIGCVDAVLYTHDHADHVNGFDDVRYAAIKRRINGENDYIMPIYATIDTMASLRNRFDYMFKISDDGLYIPLIYPHIIKDNGRLTIGDIDLDVFNQIHGAGTSLGIRVGDFGYTTDASDLDDVAKAALKGIDTWVVDCGQYGASTEQITVHPNLERVLEWNETIGAKKLYLTHLTPRQDYYTINNETPDYIECAYDGLKIHANFSCK